MRHLESLSCHINEVVNANVNIIWNHTMLYLFTVDLIFLPTIVQIGSLDITV